MTFIYPWIDLAWLPLILLVADRAQRPLALGFMAGSMLMMRLQVELMESIGYGNGITGLISVPVLTRGMFVYSLAYVAYMLALRYSPNARGSMLLAVSLTIFFAATFVFSFVMVL